MLEVKEKEKEKKSKRKSKDYMRAGMANTAGKRDNVLAQSSTLVGAKKPKSHHFQQEFIN